MDSRNPLGFNMALRTAPPRPTEPNKYAPVVGWDDRPFTNDPFEPYSYTERRKPPPRPPPPRINRPQTESRPLHFNRRPTILSSLLGRKPRSNGPSDKESGKFESTPSADSFSSSSISNGTSGTSTGVLIDFSSPPSSPTFTTRSSSDGLSIDSFGSDATSSTHNHNNLGGNASQAESGFEDDFDLFSSRKSNTELSDPWSACDPFSPPKVTQKPAIPKKPTVFSDRKEFLDPLCNGKTVVPKIATHKVPTIIRSKPTRPKPPDDSALLANALTTVLPPKSMSHMNLPIQRNVSSFPTSFELDFPSSGSSPEREPSPPMPTIPPPPPPLPEDEEDELPTPLWPQVEAAAFGSTSAPYNQTAHLNYNALHEEDEPYAIAMFDFPTGHEDDLPFTVGTKVKLLRKVNDEWMYGRLRNGMEGVFPIAYVDIKIPLKDDSSSSDKKTSQKIALARAMYDFSPERPDDLPLAAGSIVKITGKVCDEWLLGECNGSRGQFPSNYVEYLP